MATDRTVPDEMTNKMKGNKMTTFKDLQVTTYNSGNKEVTALMNSGPVEFIVYIRVNKYGRAYDSSFKRGTRIFAEFEKVAQKLLA